MEYEEKLRIFNKRIGIANAVGIKLKRNDVDYIQDARINLWKGIPFQGDDGGRLHWYVDRMTRTSRSKNEYGVTSDFAVSALNKLHRAKIKKGDPLTDAEVMEVTNSGAPNELDKHKRTRVNRYQSILKGTLPVDDAEAPERWATTKPKGFDWDILGLIRGTLESDLAVKILDELIKGNSYSDMAREWGCTRQNVENTSRKYIKNNTEARKLFEEYLRN